MTREDYYSIQAEIKAGREVGDMKKVKRWSKKLERWQLWYGAYAPVGK